jgi:hypothetical protein
LSISGVRLSGTKERAAISDGYRETKASWVELWLDLKKRGLQADRRPALWDMDLRLRSKSKTAIREGGSVCPRTFKQSLFKHPAEFIEIAKEFGVALCDILGDIKSTKLAETYIV